MGDTESERQDASRADDGWNDDGWKSEFWLSYTTIGLGHARGNNVYQLPTHKECEHGADETCDP
jgi:hypothetical protein